MARHQVKAPIAGSVWTHVAVVGQCVSVGDVICIEEVMKTEIPVEAPVAGTVAWIRSCGETLEADDLIALIDEE